MDNIPVTCFACDQSLPEKEYVKHMETIHGGARQQDAIAQKKLIEQNTPVDLPPGVKPEDLPDPDFMATMAEIQKAEQEAKIKPVSPPPLDTKPQKPVVGHPGASQTPSTPERIELTYKYIGNCENGHSVSTLEMDVDGKHFVVAFCLQENKQLESREVVNLHEPKKISDDERQQARIQEEKHPTNQETLGVEQAINEQGKKGRKK